MGRASQVKKLRRQAKADLQTTPQNSIQHLQRVITYMRDNQTMRVLASLRTGAQDWVCNFKPKRIYRGIISDVNLKAGNGQLYCTLIPHQ